MITMNESSSWIVQHSIGITLFALLLMTLSGATIITLIYQHQVNKLTIDGTGKSQSQDKLLPGALVAIAMSSISMSLGCLTMSADDARYSGSADYTIKQVKTQSSGQQIITVNDGKSDVELNVDDKDKTNYAKGDKVNIEVQSYNTKHSGKQYLGSIQRESAGSPDILSAHYKINTP